MSLSRGNLLASVGALLRLGVITPLVMVADVWLAQRLFPGFDPGAQFISELGGPAAPTPEIFNLGMMLAGVAGLFAGAGFAHALEKAGGRRQVSAFAGLWVAMTGLGAFFAGVFHWPDPMHRACGVGLAIQFAPLFTAWALWGKPGYRRLAHFSLGWFFGLLLVLALLTGVWNVRTGNDVGFWQRGHAFLGLLWLGIAAWSLERGWRARPVELEPAAA
ncbi:DUF998 domain-containing protein [Caulobacter radicis]|uniref:DUF998 domain-containing protein n=1 Tax=Caulobacter radicis TaxID=2172650 RepID=UPI000D56F1A2|nr:DUF998 domain-containing protein [Caulobacter radicis]